MSQAHGVAAKNGSWAPSAMEALGLDADGSQGQSRSSAVLGTLVTWTVSAFKSRGIHIRTDFRLDRHAIKRVGKVMCVYSTRPLAQGAAVLLEFLARLLLLIIFLALSCTPKHRTTIVEKMRTSLMMRVNSVRRLALMTADVDGASASESGAEVPADASILLVGRSGVGKTTLSHAMQRCAQKDGRADAVSIGEWHGEALSGLASLDHLRLVVIVWEAAQGTPLPAYVAHYMQQIERLPRKARVSREQRASSERPAEGALAADESSNQDPAVAADASRQDPALCAIAEAPMLPPSIVETPVTATKAATKPEALGTARRRPTSSPKAVPSEAAEAERLREAKAAAPRRPSVLVVCNKTDLMPCPMPQIQGLRTDQAFIAVSAEKGTNLRHLWTMISPLLPPATSADGASATPTTAVTPDEGVKAS